MSDDPARPPDSGPIDWGPLDLMLASQHVWEAIARFVDARMRARLAGWLSTSGDTANIACTMGTPGVPAVASSTAPWGFVVVPFYGLIERVLYYAYPAGSSYAVDVKVIRPGQTLAGAGGLFPGTPPTWSEDVNLLPGADWTGYIEPGTVLVFYLIAAGAVEVCTANVIMRTVPS